MIKHNASGGQYLDEVAARGARAEDLLNGAKADCAQKGASPAAPAAPASDSAAPK